MMKAAFLERNGIVNIISDKRLDYSLHHGVHAATDSSFPPWKELLVYREKLCVHILQRELDRTTFKGQSMK